MTYVGFRFGQDIKNQNFVEISIKKIQNVKKWDWAGLTRF